MSGDALTPGGGGGAPLGPKGSPGVGGVLQILPTPHPHPPNLLQPSPLSGGEAGGVSGSAAKPPI